MGTASGTTPCRPGVPASERLTPMLAALLVLISSPIAAAQGTRRVLVLYPVSDFQPGIIRFNENLRSVFRTHLDTRVEVYNEYLDLARFPDEPHQRRLTKFLRGKYSDRKPEVIVTGLAPSLDFVLKHRDELFPDVPVVYGAIDRREVDTRELGRGVVGVPMTVDLVPTLNLALRLHPGTRRVFVVAGRSRTDAYWIGEARRAFRGHEGRLELIYLAGLPQGELLRRVATLPERSVIYYLHVFEDGLGNTFVPADVAGQLAAAANAPVYGNYNTYVGRGIVGGRVVCFEAEGANAARVASRILEVGRPGASAPPVTAENPYLFDWRELRRWGVGEDRLPQGSVVLNKPRSFWDLYKWRIISAAVLSVGEAILIIGLLIERTSRRRAEKVLRSSQSELRALTSRLLQAQESERRRIARELHDDLNQVLALIAIELDLLAQSPPEPGSTYDNRVRGLSGRVKQLSSAVHDLSHQLHPAKLEQLGLVAALRGLCCELAQAHGLSIEFAAAGVPASIPGETALCLYRITQEALRNIIKHSGAPHARVELCGSPDAITLKISDDGAGFDPVGSDGNPGLGLVSMRERLRLVGGQIAIDARPAGGVRIDVRIPWTPDRAGSEESASQV